jgi:hypothetical protein
MGNRDGRARTEILSAAKKSGTLNGKARETIWTLFQRPPRREPSHSSFFLSLNISAHIHTLARSVCQERGFRLRAEYFMFCDSDLCRGCALRKSCALKYTRAFCLQGGDIGDLMSALVIYNTRWETPTIHRYYSDKSGGNQN